jgi:CheY-like chemotaxis protein
VQFIDVLTLLLGMKQAKRLVVDKNLHDLKFLNSFLKTLNLTCICAKEGVRTFILAQMHQPNLIFLDTTLNDLSSIQDCGDAVRTLPKETNNCNLPRIPTSGLSLLT